MLFITYFKLHYVLFILDFFPLLYTTYILVYYQILYIKEVLTDSLFTYYPPTHYVCRGPHYVTLRVASVPYILFLLHFTIYFLFAKVGWRYYSPTESLLYILKNILTFVRVILFYKIFSY